jgi:hypothetical protein
MQRAQHTFKRLLVTAMILSHCSARAGQFWTRMIAGVRVQTLFQCACRQPQSLPPGGQLQGFEIQILDGLTA